MDPIRIKSPESDFTYTIEDGELNAVGKIYLQGRQEFSFPISEVNPKPIVLERRAPAFRQGLATVGLSIVAAVFFRFLEPSEVRTFLLLLMGVLAFTGLLLVIAFIRPRRYLTFANRAGAGLFIVIRTISNSKEVDRLLDALRAAGSTF
ncbi:hypothetical protein JIN85_20285 [Luteolibacter pohnpeiensis]|uniref:Uncharacterized protein n=1 Tax=Luteolibacter pohnpeiensis TaxID=454153 RepID=A0A934S9U9_9BACT|nr:hypothetical protein [Luteolibacter pohnpeiensis]MBK1884762.1 hypothetical protein [Luteolibacter pohnpeiensis]